MKNKYGILFAFFFLFISGIMNAQMKADFIATVTGKNVIFTNYTSSNPPASTFFYRWDFGDGSGFHYTSSQTGFSHTYPQIGTYTVTLIAADSTGTFPNDTFSDNIKIICIADFNYNISGNTVSFTDASMLDSFVVKSTNISYFWLYSDSNIIKLGKNNTHTFPTNGTYKIKHTLYDSTIGNTCWDSAVKTINLSATPCYVHFRDSNFMDTTHIFIVDSVSSSSMTYQWDFGDGTSSNNPGHTIHSFQPGSYIVCLTVTDTVNSCSTTYCDSIYVYTCSAKITYSNIGSKYFFNPNVNLPGITIFTWDFGDGNAANGSGQQFVDNTYTNNGTYKVKMSLVGDASSNYCQVTDSVIINYTYSCIGKAAFGYFVNSGNNVDFMADSLIGNSATFYWDFGDGNTSTLRNPNHTYSSTGSYNVLMYFYDSTYGCGDSITKLVNLTTNSCQANFSYNIYGSSVVFNNSSTAANLSAVKYSWDFDDGSTSTQENPTHQYSQAKSYIVVLTINDTVQNCTSYYSDTITITCISRFTYNISGDSVQFTNTSAIPAGSSYLWYFGDGDSSNLENPLHIYAVSDTTYTVTLKTTNPSGCWAIKYETIAIGNPKQGISVWYQKNPYGSTFIPSYAARLYLIEYDSANQTLTAIDSVDKFNDSMHFFSNVTAGKYLVKVALLSSDSDYYDYLPTYGDTSLTWSNATTINHSNIFNSSQSIYMRKGTNPGGSGFIAGYVYQGANKKEGALENIDVYLTLKDGTPVMFAKTDIEGKYEFNNLAFGEYRLWVEIVGKPSESYDIVLDQNTPSSMEINFDVNEDEIVKRSPNASVNNVQNNKLKLYPNPVNDFLTINLTENISDLEVEVYDINGSLVIKNKMKNGEKLEVSNIKTGIYYIQIQTDNATIFRQKFLKD